MDTILTSTFAVAAVLLTLYLSLILAPQVYRFFQVWRWRKHDDKIALTYDDGPDNVTSIELMNLLDELEVKATFYLVGFRTERAPGVVQQLAERGHELGTHSYSHWHAWKIMPWREYADAERAYHALSPHVGATAPYRPPFGKISLVTLVGMWVKKRRVDWWTSPTNDTADDFPDVQKAAAAILDRRQPVILMHSHHDEPHRREFMLEMTRAIVSQARKKGLKIVTMQSLTKQPVGA
ncbi:MAG: polysaccharide deacetylase family protein [Pseudomonadales bacterium]